MSASPVKLVTGAPRERAPQRRRGRIENKVLRATNAMRRDGRLDGLDEAAVELALSLAESVDAAVIDGDYRAVASMSGELRQVLKVLTGRASRGGEDPLGDIGLPE